jgi:hypothetical protein
MHQNLGHIDHRENPSCENDAFLEHTRRGKPTNQTAGDDELPDQKRPTTYEVPDRRQPWSTQ